MKTKGNKKTETTKTTKNMVEWKYKQANEKAEILAGRQRIQK